MRKTIFPPTNKALYISSIILKIYENLTGIFFQIAIPNITTMDLAQVEKGIKNTEVYDNSQWVEVTQKVHQQMNVLRKCGIYITDYAA